jgi:UDPglucose--hexose-1-phosphate uridylyltransferase
VYTRVVSLLRYDVTTGDWVVIAPERSLRPHGMRTGEAAAANPVAFDPACPFCPGNEAGTPPSLDQEPGPDGEGWSVRLCENKYPVLSPAADTTRKLDGPLFRHMDGHGRHELLIESPHHTRTLAQTPVEQIRRILEVLHRRCLTLAKDPSLEVVQIFKNHGSAAGSSMPHPHFQIIATAVVPRQVRIKFGMAAEYYQVTGQSLYTELCLAELTAEQRVILRNDAFVAFAPFASRAPYELWIVPLVAAPTFDLASKESLYPLAEILSSVLRRLDNALGDPPYNLIVHSSPRRHADEPDFVWHIEIAPKLTMSAGFELATGMAINPVAPEAAAERLRLVSDRP